MTYQLQFKMRELSVNVVVNKVDLDVQRYPDPELGPASKLYGGWPFDRIVFPRYWPTIYDELQRAYTSIAVNSELDSE